jgi:hypothetical protein
MSAEPRPSDVVAETDIHLDFALLPPADLLRMAAAAEEALEIARLLAKTGDNVVSELIKNPGTFYEWNHYPDGDVYDAETGSQFYYHAHPANLRTGEHGHFHTFLRPAGMPAGIMPAPVPDFVPPKEPNDALSHLIGISMDEFGAPICLFTVNRWVTGEYWYDGADVLRMLHRFEISHTQPSWPVNRWLGAVLRMFRPQVEALILARDGTVAAWRGEDNVFEDRGLEVTSWCRISLAEQAAAIETAQA